MPHPRRILQLSISASGASAHQESYLSKALEAHDCVIERIILKGKIKALAIARLVARAPAFSDYDAVLAIGYVSAFAVALRARLTGSKTPVIVVGLNLATKQIRTGVAFIDRAIDKTFQRLDLSIVHSRNEIDLFHQMHGLDRSRFAFAHWGYDLPRHDSQRFAGRAPYVCMIGRNNRDFKTFCEAVEKAGVDGVIIAPAYAKFDFSVPDRIEIHRDIPFADCLSCIEHALANLILVKDDERGAGHITAVSAMLLRAPQIYSDVSVLGDYFIDGVTGLAAPVGEADAVAGAIRRIVDAPDEAKRMTDAARDYALRWLSHEATVRRQAELIVAALEKRPHDAVDPQWTKAVSALKTAPAAPAADAAAPSGACAVERKAVS